MANVTVENTNTPRITNGNRCVVRTSGDRVYVVFTMNNSAVRMRKGNQDGEPTSFSAIAEITGITGLQNIGCAAAINPTTNLIHVIYYVNDTSHGGIQAIRYVTFDPVTDTFGTPETVSTVLYDATFTFRLGISLDVNGIPHIFWRDVEKAGMDNVFRNRYSNRIGGSWNTPVNISTSTNVDDNFVHDILIGIPTSGIGADRPILVEQDSTSFGDLFLYHGNALNATSFVSSGDQSNTALTGKTSLAIDSNNIVYCSYPTPSNDNLDIIKSNGTNWTSGWSITQITTVDHTTPALAINGTNLYVYAVSTADNDIRLWKNEGAGWSEETADADLPNVGTFNDVKARYTNRAYSVLATYYFDASDATVNNGSWSNPANAADGSTTTDARSPAGTGQGNSLELHGTNAPASGGTIGAVRFRIFKKDASGATMDVRVYNNGQTQTLASFAFPAETAANGAWSQYIMVQPPSGGWTYTALQDLEVEFWANNGSGSDTRVYRCEIDILQAATPSLTDLDYVFEDSSGNVLYNTFAAVQDISPRAMTVLRPKHETKHIKRFVKTHAPSSYSAALFAQVFQKTFTIDAVLEKQGSRTFTIDAVLEKQGSRTFTIDTVLEKQVSVTFTIDGVLEKLDIQRTFTIDAVLEKLDIQKTFTLDAVLEKEQSVTFTLDAVLLKEESRTFTIDSVLEKVDIEATFTVDAVLELNPAIIMTVIRQEVHIGEQLPRRVITAIHKIFRPALIQEQSKTFTIDAVLLKEESVTFTIDSVLEKIDLQKTFTIDAVLEKEESVTFTIDTVLQKEESVTFTIDTVLLKEESRTFTIDSVLKKVDEIVTFTIDAVLKQTDIIKTFTLDAVLLKEEAQTFTIDTILEISPQLMMTVIRQEIHLGEAPKRVVVTKIHKVFAPAIQEVASKTFTIDAVLETLDLSRTFTIDAVLAKEFSVNFTIDAVLSETQSQTFTIDAVLKALDIIRTFTIDAVLKQVDISRTFTLDAVLEKLISQTFTIDAVLEKLESVTFTIDTVLQAQVPKTFTIDAVLEKLDISRTFSIDAVLQLSDITNTFTIDAILEKLISVVFTIDSVLEKLAVPKTFTLDAVLESTAQKTFTIDANLSVSASFDKTFTIDAFISNPIRDVPVVSIGFIRSVSANSFDRSVASSSFIRTVIAIVTSKI